MAWKQDYLEKHVIRWCVLSGLIKVEDANALQAGSGRSKHGSPFPQGVSVALHTRKTKAMMTICPWLDLFFRVRWKNLTRSSTNVPRLWGSWELSFSAVKSAAKFHSTCRWLETWQDDYFKKVVCVAESGRRDMPLKGDICRLDWMKICVDLRSDSIPSFLIG